MDGHNQDAVSSPAADRPVSNGHAEQHAADASQSDSRLGATVYREKQVKPNKIYIGGLPDHTRQEDLQNCFGNIGNIINIELKVGYGFVEFDSREAAEESVAKYNEGHFMGNKIRVELSHGGGRFAKFSGSEPGACFKCGQQGHWARECPNHVVVSSSQHANDRLRGQPPPPERMVPRGDYVAPRDAPSYRDDHVRGGYPPARDGRYYDYPPPRRPTSPSRDHRDYPPPPPRRGDMYDDRMRGPPLPMPPPPRYDTRGPGPYYPMDDGPSYGRGYPPPRDYDRYDRRPHPPPDGRYPYASGMPMPPRGRDGPRDTIPQPNDYRGRPMTPPGRYGGYPPSAGSEGRYRRRSQSPMPRSGSGNFEPYPPGYAAGSSAPPMPPKSTPGRDYGAAGAGYRRP
ncbi:hypothetical protein K488DRAFT_89877 [Vararia minispora EC-137]|uniref:Uncharacterized protein n=1 Tax=Vararia minispora EC-137 TaxID=1314806 RepID=A0ACB8Q9M1_9AGAM|nr:hypothetical protein K488DRAFT_89877 [Vararia minispora EC-137]